MGVASTVVGTLQFMLSACTWVDKFDHIFAVGTGLAYMWIDSYIYTMYLV